jgi:hypothetical protein
LSVHEAQLSFFRQCQSGKRQMPTSLLAALIHYVLSGAVRRFRALSATPRSIKIDEISYSLIDLAEVFSPDEVSNANTLVEGLQSELGLEALSYVEQTDNNALVMAMVLWKASPTPLPATPLPATLIRGLLTNGDRVSRAGITCLCKASKIALRVFTVSEVGDLIFNEEFNTEVWEDDMPNSKYLIVAAMAVTPLSSSPSLLSSSSSSTSSRSSSSLVFGPSPEQSSSSSSSSLLPASSASSLLGAPFRLWSIADVDPELLNNARRSKKAEERQSRKLFHSAMFNIFNQCAAQLSLGHFVTHAFAFVALATADFFELERYDDGAAFAEHMKKAYFPVSTSLKNQGQEAQRQRFEEFNNLGQLRSDRQKRKKKAMLDFFETEAGPWVKIWTESFNEFQNDRDLRSRLRLIYQRQWERLNERMAFLRVAEIPSKKQLTVHAKYIVDTTALRMVIQIWTRHTTHHTLHTTHHTPHTIHHTIHSTNYTPHR